MYIRKLKTFFVQNLFPDITLACMQLDKYNACPEETLALKRNNCETMIDRRI